MAFIDRLQHAWNIFRNRDPTYGYQSYGNSYSVRPDRVHFSGGNEKSIVTALYNKIAMDAAAIDIRHVKLDENDRYIETVNSPLNSCLTLEANIDQTGRAFKHDIYASLMDEGSIAVVPVDTDTNPDDTSSYDILSMRTGKILEWYPIKVKVHLYNELTGKYEDITVLKRNCAILENPFYAVMNERNSVLRRLIRKLNLLDAIDEQSGSGKLDLIIQLPYVVKSEARKTQAKQRLEEIQNQLKGPYGIAYTDGTERITQLNRPVENNLMKQIEYLTSMLYGQLGFTQSILDGTADEQTMLNYYNGTIEPMVATVVDEFKRKFLTKTARSQRQSIQSFRDPFKMTPVEKLAELTDKFTRNEVISSNEVRQVIGFKPSKDPRADELRNKNIREPNDASANRIAKDLISENNKEENQNEHV